MRKGFSLIELVVVMGILGTLIGVGFSSYSSSLTKSRDAKRKSDLHQIQVALEQYKQVNGTYPATSWVNSTAGTAWIPGLTSTYIKSLPVDPVNTVKTPPGAPDEDGNYVYGYYSVSNMDGLCPGIAAGDYYILAAKLESLSDHDAGQTMITSVCNWPETFKEGVYAVSNP
jgi:prepilin-type N-terminal cleavage/methylation domain-containing protein